MVKQRLCEKVTDPVSQNSLALTKKSYRVMYHSYGTFLLCFQKVNLAHSAIKISYFDPAPEVTILALKRGTRSTDKKVILLH